MATYAEQGLDRMDDAVRLALDYFTFGDGEFVRRWLSGRRAEIDRETTPESWQSIVESLSNPRQRGLVADNRDATNVLVLAGPGSGKTRVLVHRIAYLVRARRQNPRGILALAYNRHAAADIRRRLHELIGDDANGVMVLTCHALAMRLVGASFSGAAAQSSNTSFDELLSEVMGNAIALLRGDELEPEEAEWCRDARRRQRGLLLLTAHRAKGLEFDHAVVPDGRWTRRSRDEDADAPRRLYYVAMTRAKQTLAVCRLRGEQGFYDALEGKSCVLWRSPVVLPPPTAQLVRRYRSLTLKDVYLSFAGRKPEGDRVYHSIKALSPGDLLQARQHQRKWELRDGNEVQVGMLSSSFEAPSDMRCIEARVSAVARWSSEHSDAQYRQELKCDEWECRGA